MTFNSILLASSACALVVAAAVSASAQSSPGGGGDPAMGVALADGCTVATDPLHFGLLFGTAGSARSTSTIRVVCAADVTFNVSMDYGLHANGINRRMRNPATGDYLRYRLFSDPSYSILWSPKKKEQVTANSGATGMVDLSVYGEIPNYNATIRGGTYSDTVTVTVDF